MKSNSSQPLNKSTNNKTLNSTVNISSLQTEKLKAHSSSSHIFENNQANNFNHIEFTKDIVNLEEQINNLIE